MLVDPRTGRPLEGVDHCCATATTITFVNECPTPVGIFWQNASAERTLYMTLQPGVDYTQDTYVGHVWVALEGETHVHSCVAGQKPSTVVVRPLGVGEGKGILQGVTWVRGTLARDQWDGEYEGFALKGVTPVTPHIFGRMHWGTRGTAYHGEVRDGAMSGKGTFFFPNGDMLEGCFEANKPKGAGILTVLKTGDRFQVEYDDWTEGAVPVVKTLVQEPLYLEETLVQKPVYLEGADMVQVRGFRADMVWEKTHGTATYRMPLTAVSRAPRPLAVDKASPAAAASSATAAVMASNIAHSRDQLMLLDLRIQEKADEVTPVTPLKLDRVLILSETQCLTQPRHSPRRCLRLRALKPATLPHARACPACRVHATCSDFLTCGSSSDYAKRQAHTHTSAYAKSRQARKRWRRSCSSSRTSSRTSNSTFRPSSPTSNFRPARVGEHPSPPTLFPSSQKIVGSWETILTVQTSMAF